MSCQEFWKRLSGPPGPEMELEPEQRMHLAECPACAAYISRQRELAAGLKLVAERFSGLKAPARVEVRLLRAFRAHNGMALPTERRERWTVAIGWALAAALLLAIGMWLTGSRQPAPLRAGPAIAELAFEPETGAEAEGFIPLPNAEQLGPNDEVNMVRMEVPRSTMVELGVAVSADRDSDRVEADVLLGSDGLARAVRFLD